MPNALQTRDVIITLVDMAKVLRRYRVNLAERQAFLEARVSWDTSVAEWNRLHAEMLQQFGSYVPALEDLLSLSKWVHRWLEFHKSSDYSKAFQSRIADLLKVASRADSPTDEEPSFCVIAQVDAWAYDLLGYLSDLARLLKDDVMRLQDQEQITGPSVPPSGEADTPDIQGFVRNPKDVAAYRYASKIIADNPDRAVDYKYLRTVLKSHPEIRRWKPSKQRLLVHLGDWQKYLDLKDSTDDGWADDPAAVEQRKERIRAQKFGK